MILEALVMGGTIYAGVQAYQQLLSKPQRAWLQNYFPRRRGQPTKVEPAAPLPALQKANQDLALSSASLGLTVTALLFLQPTLSLASLPLMLYVFIPTYQAAYQTLTKERRINNAVLDATRMTLCVVMGYTFIAAINSWLQAFSQRLSVQAESDLQQTLDQLLGEDEKMRWVYTRGAEVEKPLAQLQEGDIVAIGPGDTVPATGLVLYGAAKVDQRLALGEAMLVAKQVGERVVAASVVQWGQLYVQLEESPPPPLAQQIRHVLDQTATAKTYTQQLGERGADHMAPRMMAAFALMLPFLGVNHAAAFLCTGFGAHMRTLGPLTVRRFVTQAAEAGLLIKDPRALEAGNLINTVIIDSQLLADPIQRAQTKSLIYTLRQRPWLGEGVTPHRFAVYLLVEADEEAARRLVAEVGCDDYLLEPTIAGRAALVERLQAAKRTICYVGQGANDAAVMEKATVSIALRSVSAIATTPAQLVLLDNDLRHIAHFFTLATAFGAKQGVNLLLPISLDIVDLGTTLILHFGLVYSVLFNYSGLLLSAFYAGLPLSTNASAPKVSSVPEDRLALPAPRDA